MNTDTSFQPSPSSPVLLVVESPITVTLDDALRMFGLPRVVGIHPGLGAEIVATIGRHGAHLECGDKRAKLDNGEAVFTVTPEEAIVAIDAAKPRGRRP